MQMSFILSNGICNNLFLSKPTDIVSLATLLAAAARVGKSWALSWMDLSSGRLLARLLPGMDDLESQLGPVPATCAKPIPSPVA